MKTTKKLLSVILAILMIASAVPIAFASDTIAKGTCGIDLSWTLTFDGVLTISGSGDMYDYSSISPFTSYASYIETVVFDERLTSIGDNAFMGCVNVTSITLPDSVKSIGIFAFSNCTGLTSINIPDGVTCIEYASFSGCSALKSITISLNTTSIEEKAFYGCESLVFVVIPAGITSIGNDAFYNCPAVFHYLGTEAEWSKVSVGSGNTYLTDEDLHIATLVNIAPTCVNWGIKNDAACDKCLISVLKRERIPPTGIHVYDEIKSTNNLTRPVQNEDGTWTQGYYTHHCTADKLRCTKTTIEYVDRADYTAYNKAVVTIASYLTNDRLTDTAKSNILAELKKYADENADISTNENGKLRQDLIVTEQYIVDTATANAQTLIDIVEGKIKAGTIVKADYTEIEAYVAEIELKIADNNVTEENTAYLEVLKDKLDSLKADSAATAADVAELMEKFSLYDEILDLSISNGAWVEKETTPEVPDSSSNICDDCGETHTGIFSNIICSIKRFFNKIAEFFSSLA